MKNYFLSFGLILIVLLNSCSSDFKVGADYKDYAVVFGLLSRSDTAHYIKITKGFYDEKQNNLLVAQIADSLYHNNLEVKLYKMNGSTIIDSAKLPRVDLNLEGYQKDSGVFVNTPNWAYKYKLADTVKLDPTKKYRLSVKNLTTGKVVYGETDIIDNTKIKITSPSASNNEPLTFSKIGVSTTTFQWNSPSSVSIYDLYIRLNYEEKNSSLIPATLVRKSTLLPLQKNIPNNSNAMALIVTAEEFYRALQSEIKPAPNYITRYLDTPDVVIAAAGLELKNYIDVTNAQGGITYDQIKPSYTNMKGGEVLGLFSTRATTNSNQINFTKATHDSILFGSFTKSLNFVGNSSK